MKKIGVIKQLLGDRLYHTPQASIVGSFAPTNIALCKYWGKRNQELNIPITPSLSISLVSKGTMTAIKTTDEQYDSVTFNGNVFSLDSPFCQRLFAFIDLFRSGKSPRFHMDFSSNIPLAAGLASSASGFASLVLALDELYSWRLSLQELSILARLGSGSACRSLWNGFVEWQVGDDPDGMDSYGIPLHDEWPELCVGLLMVSSSEKAISSREAMERTKTTSSLYSQWPEKVATDLQCIKQAITDRDFTALGSAAESNAMTMHAMMLSAWPPISYCQPETIAAMQRIWSLRHQGLPLYFTQDAGPNLKLLFLRDSLPTIQAEFKQVDVLQPFID